MDRQLFHANEESMKFLQGLGGAVVGPTSALLLCRETQLVEGGWCSVLTLAWPLDLCRLQEAERERNGGRGCSHLSCPLVFPGVSASPAERECVFLSLVQVLEGLWGTVFFLLLFPAGLC